MPSFFFKPQISLNARNNLAYVLIKIGKYSEAEKILKNIYKKNPRYITAINNLVLSLLYQNKKKETIIFVDFLSKNPYYKNRIPFYRKLINNFDELKK